MIKTLVLSAGGSAVKLGGLQTQPTQALDDDASPENILGFDHGQLTASTSKTTAEIVQAAAGGAVLQTQHGRVILNADMSDQGASSPIPHDVWDGALGLKRRLRGMEQLTGLAHDRPEIVAVMPFQPVYDDPPKAGVIEALGGGLSASQAERMTPAGRFIKSQQSMRMLRHATVERVVSSAASISTTLQQEILQRAASVRSELDALSDSSAFMLGVVRAMVKLRGQLDLRDDVHKVSAEQIIAQHVTSQHVPDAKFSFTSPSVDGAGTHNIADVLHRFGYDRATAQDTFASTKLWLQCLNDLREMLRDHSLEFVGLPTTQRGRDRSVTAIRRTPDVRFFRAAVSKLPSLEEISTEHAGSALASTTAQIDEGFLSLYEGTQPGSQESRIAALIHLISREHRYSLGLAQADVKRLLLEQFGFTTLEGSDNSALFDAVIGLPGLSITDTVDQFPGSLSALAHRRLNQQDTVVLTFESRYLELNSDAYMPGSAYHVDDIIDVGPEGFSTARLNELASMCGAASSRFTKAIVGMDMLATGRPLDDPGALVDGAVLTAVSSPLGLCEHVLSKLVDTKSGKTLASIANDPVAAVYAQAYDDTRLRAMLFLLTLSRLSQMAGDAELPSVKQLFGAKKSEVINQLVDEITEHLRAKTPQINTSETSLGKQNVSLTLESLRDALRSGSSIVTTLDSVMAVLLRAFSYKHKAMQSGRTRFSAVQDTAVLMMCFDLLCTITHAYCTQKIVGAAEILSGTQLAATCFVVSRADSAGRPGSTAEIRSMLLREVSLVSQAVGTVLAVLVNLQSSAHALLNHLQSPASRAALARVTAVVGAGENLQALFTEQQIMLLGSTVADLIGLAKHQDPDSRASNEQLRFLDDSGIAARAAAEIEAALSDPVFTSSKGYNKRILVVGLPHGISEKLRQTVDLQAVKAGSFRSRQADFVRVVVHKMDVQMSDLVFKPRSFLFELSRFPVRDTSLHLPLAAGATLRHALTCLPSRDFGSSAGATTTYPDPRDFGLPITSARNFTFAGSDYAFLTSADRRALLRNHGLSYFMDVYVRLLTGFSLSDHHFELAAPAAALSPAFTAQLSMHRAALVDDAMKARAVEGTREDDVALSSTGGRQKAVRADTRANVRAASSTFAFDSMDSDARAVTVQDAKTLSGLTRELTTLADPLAVSRSVLSPKRFDRVFSIIVDPDEFEVDEDATSKTPVGRQALSALIKQGEIVTVPMSAAESLLQGLKNSTESLRLRSRDRNAGDMAFERYFVTVEPAFGTR